jgi:CHU_C Type IX secretion signal domain
LHSNCKSHCLLKASNLENKLFYLKSIGMTYDLSIYDRWGNLIFTADKSEGGDPSRAWSPGDNKEVQGVYVYKITLYTDDGLVTKYGTVAVL